VARFFACILAVALYGIADFSIAGTAGYLYVADSDTTPTTEASVDLPVGAQTVATDGEHSLFEMSMSNMGGSSGDIIEIGVTTDFSLNGDQNPHWFVSSWVNGSWKGYDGSSGFVSNEGSFWNTPLTGNEGTPQAVTFEYFSGNWWLGLNGAWAGYFPGSEWSGLFTQSSFTDVFGEVYWDGTFYPTLNGTVSAYSSSAGGHLSTINVGSPYVQSNATGTGFTASGPNFTPGDVNHDGIVNAADIGVIASDWMHTGIGAPGDANNDGIVNASDIEVVASHWLWTPQGAPGGNASVPEPSTLVLAALGALAPVAWRFRRGRNLAV
jgi:PEP-CTERM motif/Neprosin